MLHFNLHMFLVFIVVVENVRLTNFYSKTWYPWWWNNCEMKELGTIYYNSFPWISLIKLWNHLANSPVYLVHSRAGLQSKTYSTYSTKDNRGSLLMTVLVQSFCGIWSGNKNDKKFNEAHQLFSEQTNDNFYLPLHSKPCLVYRHPLSSKSHY